MYCYIIKYCFQHLILCGVEVEFYINTLVVGVSHVDSNIQILKIYAVKNVIFDLKQKKIVIMQYFIQIMVTNLKLTVNEVNLFILYKSVGFRCLFNSNVNHINSFVKRTYI